LRVVEVQTWVLFGVTSARSTRKHDNDGALIDMVADCWCMIKNGRRRQERWPISRFVLRIAESVTSELLTKVVSCSTSTITFAMLNIAVTICEFVRTPYR
jgi:hypothetical protein